MTLLPSHCRFSHQTRLSQFSNSQFSTSLLVFAHLSISQFSSSSLVQRLGRQIFSGSWVQRLGRKNKIIGSLVQQQWRCRVIQFWKCPSATRKPTCYCARLHHSWLFSGTRIKSPSKCGPAPCAWAWVTAKLGREWEAQRRQRASSSPSNLACVPASPVAGESSPAYWRRARRHGRWPSPKSSR